MGGGGDGRQGHGDTQITSNTGTNPEVNVGGITIGVSCGVSTRVSLLRVLGCPFAR
jgi:hypothetical protein